MYRWLAPLVVALVPALAVGAQHGSYVLTRDADGLLVQSERYGTWRGFGLISTARPAQYGDQQTLRFEFVSRDYFSPANRGHFAVGLLGRIGADLRGRGVVIGNVAELPGRGRCDRTDAGHRVVIEGFYGSTNCVLGSSTASIPLVDGERYRLEVSVQGRLISYQLDQRVGARWQAVSQASVYDVDGPDVAGGQWWLTEVFSAPGWSVSLFGVEEISRGQQ